MPNFNFAKVLFLLNFCRSSSPGLTMQVNIFIISFDLSVVHKT